MFIAEIGINHQGDIKIAKELIRMAKMAGADIVKFQKRSPDICVPEDQKGVIKDSIFGVMTYLEYKHRIEFGKKEYDEIDRYCRELDIGWTASPWDVESLDFILQYDIPFIKVASASLTDVELLKAMKRSKVPVLISTGMSTEDEIEKAVDFLGVSCFGILHCNSEYPSAEENINLSYMTVLQKKYPNHSIGYSGHEIGIFPSVISASLGADIIERHFTFDRNAKGSDHKVSLEPWDFLQMVTEIKKVNKILGTPIKVISNKEYEMRNKLRINSK